MKLFHGSNVIVNTPRILTKLRALDFGAGFYLTSSKEQERKACVFLRFSDWTCGK